MPQYARNFAAMGLASVGIAAPDPAQAAGLLEPYLEVLDETIVRPVVKMPSSSSPGFDDVFETLSMLVASLLAPSSPASPQPAPDATTPAPASFEPTKTEAQTQDAIH